MAGCSKGVEPLPPREGAPLAQARASAPLPQAPASAKLPSLAVADLGGRLSTTDSLRGRILVLNVWATWCAPCRREMPSLDQLHRELDPSRYLVAGIAVDDDPILVREYLAQQRLGFANFVAVRRSDVLDALALRGIPATLVVAADGTVLHRISGPRDWSSAEVREMLEAAYDIGARRSAHAPKTVQRGHDVDS
jgi:thiol-disulfide isomerase/thioredoxin